MQKVPRSFTIICILIGIILIPSQSGRAYSHPVIEILAPGNNSKVSDPIRIKAEIQLGEAKMMRITLTNQYQSVLARQLKLLPSSSNQILEINTALSYELPVKSVKGRLSISLSDRFNRPLSLRSVSLLLQTDGELDIEAMEPQDSWLSISSPNPGEDVNGGQVIISGQVTPINGTPIYFEIYSQKGRVISTRQLAVIEPGKLQTFSISMPYNTNLIKEEALITIRQKATSHNETIILDSLPLILSP
jgi:hypothetical protein